MNGFCINFSDKGVISLISSDVQHYLGFTEHDLFGHNIFMTVHEGDHQLLRRKLMPKPEFFGPDGKLTVPKNDSERQKLSESLSREQLQFVLRFKKRTTASDLAKFLVCDVEGALHRAKHICHGSSRCHPLPRAGARAKSCRCSENDVVFIGVARPSVEAFSQNRECQPFRMEYKSRHLTDGKIIQVEQNIALVAGYMTNEVEGSNFINFIHKEDVRCVVSTLFRIYKEHRIFGELCYRTMAKTGQVLYMRTCVKLEVDPNSHTVTTFICTNTVVDEVEGRHIVNEMKRNTTLDNKTDVKPRAIEDEPDYDYVPVEEPELLKAIIIHHICDLPALTADPSPYPHIVPPQKALIIQAIDSSYDIIRIHKRPTDYQPSPIADPIIDSINLSQVTTTPKDSFQIYSYRSLNRSVGPYKCSPSDLRKKSSSKTRSAPKKINRLPPTTVAPDLVNSQQFGQQSVPDEHNERQDMSSEIFTGIVPENELFCGLNDLEDHERDLYILQLFEEKGNTPELPVISFDNELEDFFDAWE